MKTVVSAVENGWLRMSRAENEITTFYPSGKLDWLSTPPDKQEGNVTEGWTTHLRFQTLLCFIVSIFLTSYILTALH